MQKEKKVHFIAIGGNVMHSLAIAMKNNGYKISGSDDEIFEPSKSRLNKNQLLPNSMGWDDNKITPQLDAVILGMHAKLDNPELIKAKELGLKIYSYPEFIRKESSNKQRIVISGSHGKTTITAIILHVLDKIGKPCDYLIGAQIAGFKNMVRLSDSPIIIIEGDEYPCSPLDPTPKLLKYEHHIGLISGIAWDHANIYKTFKDYVQQFHAFADSSPKAGSLIYCKEDNLAKEIGSKKRIDVNQIEYKTHKYKVKNGVTYLISDRREIPIQIFGEHNMQNINGAKALLKRIGVTDEVFYEAIQSFIGVESRSEKIAEKRNTTLYKDFAHAPSKVSATIKGFKNQFPEKKLIACLELHTFSSLNKNFISEYHNTLNLADQALVYFDPEVVAKKNLENISKDDIRNAFSAKKLTVATNISEVESFIKSIDTSTKSNIVMMTSGKFGGINFSSLL